MKHRKEMLLQLIEAAMKKQIPRGDENSEEGEYLLEENGEIGQ